MPGKLKLKKVMCLTFPDSCVEILTPNIGECDHIETYLYRGT